GRGAGGPCVFAKRSPRGEGHLPPQPPYRRSVGGVQLVDLVPHLDRGGFRGDRGPPRVPRGGEVVPGGHHPVRQRGVDVVGCPVQQERREVGVEVAEGERQVECVAGAESPTQGGTLGGQAEDVGTPAALCVCLGQAHGELVEHRIAHDRGVEVLQGGFWVQLTIGRKRAGTQPCAGGRGLQVLLVVDLHALPHFGEQAVLVQVVAHEQVHLRGGAACGSTQGGFGQAFVTDNRGETGQALGTYPGGGGLGQDLVGGGKDLLRC